MNTNIENMRYAKTSIRPGGIPAKPGLCVEEVHGRWSRKQCSRAGGHGPAGLYCRQHATALLRYATSVGQAPEAVAAARMESLRR